MNRDEMTVLKEAIARYPVTVDELRRAVPLRPTAFDMALRGLVRKGMVQLEPLGDVTYVRPMALVEPPPPPKPLDEDDPTYL